MRCTQVLYTTPRNSYINNILPTNGKAKLDIKIVFKILYKLHIE